MWRLDRASGAPGPAATTQDLAGVLGTLGKKAGGRCAKRIEGIENRLLPGLTNSDLGITADKSDCQPPVFIAQCADLDPELQLVTLEAKLLH